MAETNNKEKTLAGIIYHDIKAYLDEKKELRQNKKAIKQRKKAENRKIKFRSLFIEKCKRGYHNILAKYYTNKEKRSVVNGIAKNGDEVDLKKIIDKKILHGEKYEEKKKIVDEMEQIRDEKKAVKKAEKAIKKAEDLAKAAAEVIARRETAPATSEPAQEAEELATSVEEPQTKEETAPAVEESQTKEETAPAVEESQTKEETAPAVEEIMTFTMPAIAMPGFEETMFQGEAAPAVEEPQTKGETTPIAETVEVIVEEPAQVVETVSIDSVMAGSIAKSNEQVQTAEVLPIQDEGQKIAEEEQTKLAENVQAILNEEKNVGKTDMDILKQTEELGKSVALLQKEVAISLASKQREINEVKDENTKLTVERDNAINENAKLIAERDNAINENAKNVKVYNSVIVSKDEEVATLRQQLEQERIARTQDYNAKIQAETQFRNYVAAIQNIQFENAQSIQEDEPAKVARI